MEYFYKTNKKVVWLVMVFFALTNTAHSQSILSKPQKNKITGQWLHSEALKPGMKLLTKDNRLLTVEEVWQEKNQTTTTYNFEVKNTHSYFVGEQKLWAHNSCWETTWIRYEAAVDTPFERGIVQPVRKRIVQKGSVRELQYEMDIVDDTSTIDIVDRIYDDAFSAVAGGAPNAPTVVTVTIKSPSRGGLARAHDEIKTFTLHDRAIAVGLPPPDGEFGLTRVFQYAKSRFVSSDLPLGLHRLRITMDFRNVGDAAKYLGD